MNMPDSCVGCPICQRADDNLYYCMATFKIIVDVWLKAHWCPLRELPQKREEGYAKDVGLRDCGFIDGWNACIDEIMKGSEEK